MARRYLRATRIAAALTQPPMLKQTLLALAVVSAPLSSQTLTPIGSARTLWQGVARNIAESANDVPADKYSYKPTPDVRSFGELFAHVAGAELRFCAMALGESPPTEDAVEKKALDKQGLIQALRASNEACMRAYAQTDAAVAAPVNASAPNPSRLQMLIMNATHDSEHYGNIVTYLRMNGMVPPSSKPRPRGH